MLRVNGSRFGVESQGAEFGVWKGGGLGEVPGIIVYGLWFRVTVSEFRVHGLRLRIERLGFRDWGMGWKLRDRAGVGSRGWGLGQNPSSSSLSLQVLEGP